MDRSLTRRGKPCWYKQVCYSIHYATIHHYNPLSQEGVGLIAVNDALWIEGTMYKILRTHFRSEPYYLNVLELFHDVSNLNGSLLHERRFSLGLCDCLLVDHISD